MSKVIIEHAVVKDSYPVAAATITTGWKPGQAFKFNTTGDAVILAAGDATMFIGIDASTEVTTSPTGSLVTAIYGAGTKFVIDHSAEVLASDATRAYESDVPSAALNADLYISTDSKWSTTATGSVKGKLYQIPTAANSYGMGVILRF